MLIADTSGIIQLVAAIVGCILAVAGFVGLWAAARYINTSRKVTSGRYWRERPFEEVTALLGEDWPRYAA